jgi:hypothetical protein
VNDVSLWGTFSVADHLRRRPFVADVLLYDLLLVPVPDSEDEMKRWRDRKRDPELQHDLLELVGELGVPVPWSIERHDQWAQRYSETVRPGTDEAMVRDDVAQAVASDANSIAAARVAATGAGAPDPDDPANWVTRQVLAEEFGSLKDRALVARIPRVNEIEAVVAYGSYRKFSIQRGNVLNEVTPGGQPVFTFGWSFFVPSNSKRSDKDLLREAVELAHAEEILTWRAAVQRWRRNTILLGKSDDAALADMEAMIADYHRAARRLKIQVRSRWGLAVTAAAAGAAAAFVPPVGIPAAIFGLGSLIPSGNIPKSLEAAAMFHEARRRFK